jgi:putative ABC transport system permease protein
MIGNYLTVAFRNLVRHPTYSMINLIGLSVALAAVVMIGLFVRHEYAFNSSQTNADRMYRVLREFSQEESSYTEEGLSGGMVPELRASSPEVEVSLRWAPTHVWVGVGERFFQQVLVTTETPVFEFFDIPIVTGSPESFYKAGGGVFLSEKMAHKFFGETDPIGQTVTIDGGDLAGDYPVTGLVQVPENSTLMFDFLISVANFSDPGFRWTNWLKSGYSPIHVYLRLKQGADPSVIEDRIHQALQRNVEAEIAEQSRYHLQPFRRIYLHSKVDHGMVVQTFRAAWTKLGDIDYVHTSALVAGVILLIAGVNFTNLSTARSMSRSREVGVRKAVGADRRQIMIQFLGEAVLLSLGAMVVGMFFVELSLPLFNALVGRDLSLNLMSDGGLLLSVTTVGILTGILAGSYPAFILSRFSLVSILGKTKTGARGGWVRKTLVISQFAISAVLIIATFVVNQQVQYIQNKDLGFDREQVLIVPIFWEARNETSYGRYGIDLKLRFQEVKGAFLDHPNVLSAGVSRFYLQEHVAYGELMAEGRDHPWRARTYSIDDTFLETMDIPVVAGRGFSTEYAELYERDRWRDGTEEQFLINEAAARQLSWKAPVGKRLRWHSNRPPGTVVGVVKDFHLQTLHTPVEPIVFDVNHYNNKMVMLKVSGERIQETIEHLEKVWNRYLPSRPFRFEFLDQKIAGFYRAEQKQSAVFQTFAMMAVFVACLGLLGLASFAAQQRTKEMGIRKVVGASSHRLVAMMSSEFARLVLVANLLAWPVGWWMMRSWLESFAYRVDLGIGGFIAAGVITVTIALATVSTQAWRAAKADPVETLRQE